MPVTYAWGLVVPEVPPTAAPAPLAALRRDLKLDVDGDLDLSTGDLQFTSGREAIGQALDIGFGMVKGEWFLDLDEGFDLFGLVLVSNPNEALIQAEARRIAMTTPGVIGVKSIVLDLDRPARELTIELTVLTDEGELARAVRIAA